MPANDGFAAFLIEQLAPLGPVSTRRMFGAMGVFRGDLMFGIIADEALYFRVDDLNKATFEEARATPPLSYERLDRIIDLPFWRAPDRLLDEPDDLLIWARAALAAAGRVAAKRKPGRRKA